MTARFSETEIIKALRDYDNGVQDLLSSNHNTFANNFKRLVFILKDNSVLSTVIAEELPDVDFSSWYKKAESTVDGAVGSGSLDWPLEKLSRLALQKALLDAIAEGQEGVLGVCTKFMYPGNDFDLMVDEFNHQIVEPFTRDVRTLVEDFEDETDRDTEVMRQVELELQKDIAFVLMPISGDLPELEDVLNAIKRACEQHGIVAVRSDEIEHSDRITDLILEHVRTSRILICDVTHERPNVYYELGYAHGFGKQVILAAKVGTKLHFDIKDYNVIFYSNCSELEKRVLLRLTSVLT